MKIKTRDTGDTNYPDTLFMWINDGQSFYAPIDGQIWLPISKLYETKSSAKIDRPSSGECRLIEIENPYSKEEYLSITNTNDN